MVGGSLAIPKHVHCHSTDYSIPGVTNHDYVVLLINPDGIIVADANIHNMHPFGRNLAFDRVDGTVLVAGYDGDTGGSHTRVMRFFRLDRQGELLSTTKMADLGKWRVPYVRDMAPGWGDSLVVAGHVMESPGVATFRASLAMQLKVSSTGPRRTRRTRTRCVADARTRPHTSNHTNARPPNETTGARVLAASVAVLVLVTCSPSVASPRRATWRNSSLCVCMCIALIIMPHVCTHKPVVDIATMCAQLPSLGPNTPSAAPVTTTSGSSQDQTTLEAALTGTSASKPKTQGGATTAPPPQAGGNPTNTTATAKLTATHPTAATRPSAATPGPERSPSSPSASSSTTLVVLAVLGWVFAVCCCARLGQIQCQMAAAAKDSAVRAHANGGSKVAQASAAAFENPAYDAVCSTAADDDAAGGENSSDAGSHVVTIDDVDGAGRAPGLENGYLQVAGSNADQGTF